MYNLLIIKQLIRSKEKEQTRVKQLFLLIAFIWSLILIFVLTLDILHHKKDLRDTAENTARGAFNKDQSFRLWSSSHGGVYVPVTEKTPPNPSLAHLPDRDIFKPDGTKLTLMNPAYMLRQMMNDYTGLYGVKGKITSLKYIYEGNKPDKWEEKALKEFENGTQEVYEYTTIDEEPYLRLMHPMIITQECLKCHAQHGYKLGDVRGGVGISLPLTYLYKTNNENLSISILLYTGLWFIVMIGIVYAFIRESLYLKRKKATEDEMHKQEELMIAQSRNAAMGEMIGMIAHQWRQPLSIIAMEANNVMADIEFDSVENNSLRTTATEIIQQTQELSKTIDDFKNFFKPNKEIEQLFVKDIVEDALAVIGKSMQNNGISLIKNINNNKKIDTYSRELMQVFINIFKNSKEVLIDNNIDDKKLIITVEDKETTVDVKICDNGGGIAEDIIDKIYEPYFTTKGAKNGTGLGLYISYIIIEKHLNGKLSAYNENSGACFLISLPIINNSGVIE